MRKRNANGYDMGDIIIFKSNGNYHYEEFPKDVLEMLEDMKKKRVDVALQP